MTTISEPRGNLPVGTNLAVVVGSNLCFSPIFFFFFFLVGQGGGSAVKLMKDQRRDVVSRPSAAGNSMERCPIIWHRLFARTLPTVTRRNLV